MVSTPPPVKKEAHPILKLLHGNTTNASQSKDGKFRVSHKELPDKVKKINALEGEKAFLLQEIAELKAHDKNPKEVLVPKAQPTISSV